MERRNFTDDTWVLFTCNELICIFLGAFLKSRLSDTQPLYRNNGSQYSLIQAIGHRTTKYYNFGLKLWKVCCLLWTNVYVHSLVLFSSIIISSSYQTQVAVSRENGTMYFSLGLGVEENSCVFR